jgi:23S rRNA pseudouridine1911/1915/1917 synthase
VVVTRSTRFTVPAEDAGLRLDQVVPRHVPGLSRRKARAVIDLGGVFVDRTRVKMAGRLVQVGQVIEVNLGGALERAKEDAAPVAVPIVFEDAHVLVVDKPAGLVTAPTPESNRGDLLDLLSRSHGEVHLVHRIDLPTSGLLVFARTRAANKALGVDREYRAVAIGEVTAQTIDRPIEGRRAVTHVEVIERLPGLDAPATLLRARLETGRGHQIRIHLAGIGHPVLGDHQHGGTAERTYTPRCPRMALHAAVLGFAHPETGERLRFESAMPEELARYVERLRAVA